MVNKRALTEILQIEENDGNWIQWNDSFFSNTYTDYLMFERFFKLEFLTTNTYYGFLSAITGYQFSYGYP